MSNRWDLQKAVFTRLSDQAWKVYDDVPEGVVFPYVTIGDDTTIAWDGDDWIGGNHTLTIHVWTRTAGRREGKQIMDAIDTRLNRFALTVGTANVLLCDAEFSDTFMDPDGITRHGVMRFRVMIEN